ncbi:MAG: hypothetical protein RBS77_01505 [Candidatus Moranbacteria bacterium]|jgi:hypothetical protein|nr:hypothetical protein [Candidatus Moranbacteria bacterium]
MGSNYKPSSKYGALFFNAVHNSVLPTLKRETAEIAHNIRKDVIRRIRRQVGLQGAPLSVNYLRRKIRFGLDWRTLIATEQYVRSIIVEQTEYGARIGVKSIDHVVGPFSKRVPVPMHKIAEWLEYGTVRPKIGRGGPASGQPWYMPPRPHWRPAQARFARELSLTKKKLTRSMEAALLGALLGEIDEHPVEAEPRFMNPLTFDYKGADKIVAPTNAASRMMTKYKSYISEGGSGDEEQI